jgi:hypothetical protein
MKMRIKIFLVSLLVSSLSWTQINQQKYAEYAGIADSLFKMKKYNEAADNYTTAFSYYEWKATPNHRYQAGAANAQAGRMDSAFYHLNRMISRDLFVDTVDLFNDAYFVPMHADVRWKASLNSLKAKQEVREKDYDRPLIATLKGIHHTDQLYRQQLDSIEKQFGMNSNEIKAHWKKIQKTDKANLKVIRKIVDKRGWLGANVIGQEGNMTLFLVIQHSDLKTQQKYLPMMRDAVQKGNAIGSELALLEDRVNIGIGQPQIYGSQIGRKEDGTYFVIALKDPDNVDNLRASVGLEPLAQYASYFGITWDLEQYKKDLPELLKLISK